MAADPARWHAPVLTVVGVLVCLYGLRTLGASYSITKWPVVPARVILSQVEPTANGRFRPHVEYELYLAGLRYVGTGIVRPATTTDPVTMAFSRERAESVVAAYPIGRELLAGYDPVNPSRTVLQPRFNWWTTVPVVMGALLAAVGIMMWRQNRKPPAVQSS